MNKIEKNMNKNEKMENIILNLKRTMESFLFKKQKKQNKYQKNQNIPKFL